MSGKLDNDLLDECAGWISEMLVEEEGVFLAPDLIRLILRRERELPPEAGAAHPETARRLVETLAAEGVRSAPQEIDESFVLAVLNWEDEFLALAGIPRATR